MSLPNITLWYGDIPEATIEHSVWLEPFEQSRANNLQLETTRQRYIAAHAQLRLLLASVVNTNPQQLRIGRNQYGKPYLSDYPEVAFNLSHTANKLAVVIGVNCQLGVDIEQIKPRNSITALVARCFAEEEQAYWQQQPKAEQLCAFYPFWVRKEAVVKAIGRGIALGLSQCVINPDNPSRLIRLPAGYGRPEDWLIGDIDCGEAVCGAWAMKDNNIN
jgi:4'-phosphopantetheinyl transferase